MTDDVSAAANRIARLRKQFKPHTWIDQDVLALCDDYETLAAEASLGPVTGPWDSYPAGQLDPLLAAVEALDAHPSTWPPDAIAKVRAAFRAFQQDVTP